MAGMDDLLRMLEPVVRPVGPGRLDNSAVPPIESQTFEQLLHHHTTPGSTPESTPGSSLGSAFESMAANSTLPASPKNAQPMPANPGDDLDGDSMPSRIHAALLSGLDRVENPSVMRIIAENAENATLNR